MSVEVLSLSKFQTGQLIEPQGVNDVILIHLFSPLKFSTLNDITKCCTALKYFFLVGLFFDTRSIYLQRIILVGIVLFVLSESDVRKRVSGHNTAYDNYFYPNLLKFVNNETGERGEKNEIKIGQIKGRKARCLIIVMRGGYVVCCHHLVKAAREFTEPL